MAFLVAAVCAAAGTLVGAITTHMTHSKGDQTQNSKKNEKLRQMEEKLTKATELFELSNKEKAAAEANFFNLQEAYRAEQMRKEGDLNIEKEEIKKAQADRERLMEKRHEQWKRNQKEMIEAEKKHQRKLTKEAKEGLKRSHDEFERQMSLDRERLAKEEEFLSNARLDHERCLEEERERFKQSQSSFERDRKEDLRRMAHERKIFAEAQKKWDNDRVVLEKNYDKLQTKFNEVHQQLRREQRALEESLKNKMNDLMDEQKNLTEFEKEQKLKDLTETFLDYCEMYYNDPDKLTKEAEAFQRKFSLQLNKVKNSMKTGDKSLPRLDVWKEGAVLDMKILTLLCSRGEIKPEAIGAASQKYQRDMVTLVSNFNADNALPCNVAELRAIENSFNDKFQDIASSLDRALPESALPLLAILAPTASESSSISPTSTECAVAGRGVSAATSGVHLESEILTKSEDASLLSGSEKWARCDALAGSLRQSALQD